MTGELNLKTVQAEEYNQFAGRPSWNRIMKEKAVKHKGTEIGVFLCGPAVMAVDISGACRNNSTKEKNVKSPTVSRTIFKFHKENF